MKKTIFIFCFVIFSLSVEAQVEADLTGYFVCLPILQINKKGAAGLFGNQKNDFSNLTRFRLRPAVRFSENTRINIEYEVASSYSSSKNDYFSISPKDNPKQVYNLRWDVINGNNFSIVQYFDRFSLRQNFGNGYIEAGRQRISWGTGRIWNPTDLFNPVNPIAFYKIEKDGADAVSMKYTFGDFTDVNLVYNPQYKFKSSNYGLRFRTNFGEYDYSLMSGYFNKRIVSGIDFAGNFWSAGVRGEGIISLDNMYWGNSFIKFILGADQQFSAKLYGLIEYYFNGEGKTDTKQYDFERLLKEEVINLGCNYFYAMTTYQVSDLLTITIQNNINLNDRSGYLGGSGNYSLNDNFYLNFGAQFTYGSNDSEYRNFPNSVYLQTEYYF